MKKIEILDFRFYIEKGNKCEIYNKDLISNILVSKGLVYKEQGLCAEPFNKYFSFINSNNISDNEHINTIYVTVNYNTSTRKKKVYFYSIQINYINGFYYLCCLAQSTYYKNNSIGAKHVVYEVNENEISVALDEIFKDIEF